MSTRGPVRLEQPLLAPNADGSPEVRARTVLEERFGQSFSDEEWRLYRSRLIAFARLLREWETTE